MAVKTFVVPKTGADSIGLCSEPRIAPENVVGQLPSGTRLELVEQGGEILAPAFHHGSEIEAFRQAADRGYDSSADIERIEALLSPSTDPVC